MVNYVVLNSKFWVLNLVCFFFLTLGYLSGIYSTCNSRLIGLSEIWDISYREFKVHLLWLFLLWYYLPTPPPPFFRFCAVGTAECCHWFFKALRLGLWPCCSHSIFCCLRPVLMITSLKWKTHPVSFSLLICFLHFSIFMLLATLQNVCVCVYFIVYNYCLLESSSSRGFSATTLLICL